MEACGVRLAIDSMGLQQFNELLTKPIKIDFPIAALTQPEISWSNYSGSIKLDDLPKIVTEIFKRGYSKNEALPLEKKCIHLLRQIDLCREVIKKVESLKNKVFTRWKEKTLGGFGSFLNETWSTYVNTLKNLNQELDQKEKKVKYIYQENLKEQDFIRNFFNMFSGFQTKPKAETFYFYSFNDGNNFENIFGSRESRYTNMDSTELQIDPYQVMNLPYNATPAQIKKRYHQLALELHPDKNFNDPNAKEKFQKLNSAYEILKKKTNLIN
jgi:hypothetical protein